MEKAGPMTASLFCLALLWMSSAARELETGHGHVQIGAASSTAPHVERLGPLNTLVVWQLPDGPIKKVLIVLESLNIVPTDYWKRSENCPVCRGLPENVKIVSDALDRGYAVFVPSSITPPIGNWESWPKDNPEIQNVLSVFSEWKQARGLQDVPNVGLGTSAGGHIVSTLGLYTGFFESITIMISHGTAEAFESITGSEYPPTLFLHMPKDSATAALVTEIRKDLSAKGVVNSELQWTEHPLTPAWFSDAIEGLPLSISYAIYQSLKREGWLNDEDYLNNDSYHNDDWPITLRGWNVLPNDPIVQDKLMFEDSISQELEVAFAGHVTLARLNEPMFNWLDGGYNSYGYSLSS